MKNSSILFDKVRGKKVVIIGDVMLDHYMKGKVERISPEAPVPVVHLQSSEYRLGGAANVALNVQAFGAVPIIFSIIGKDQHATNFRSLMEDQQLDASYIFSDDTRPTTRKTRILSGYQQLLRVDEEKTHPLKEPLVKEILDSLALLFEKDPPAVLVFQDYNKGMLPPSIIEGVLKLSNSYSIPTVVDPKFDNFLCYQGCTLFKPNIKELREGIGQPIAIEVETLTKACQELDKTLKCGKFIITLSEKGVFVYSEGKGSIIPVKPREIVDVCGAGDAVIATTAIGIALDLDLSQIAQLANIAGGIVCESMGVSPLNFNKLELEMRQMYPSLS